MNFRKREAVALASLAWRSFPDPADGVVVASSGFDENLGFPQGVEDHPMCTLKTEKEESEDAWGGVLGFCRRGGRQQREAEQDERRRSPAAQRQSLEEPSARGPRGRAIIGRRAAKARFRAGHAVAMARTWNLFRYSGRPEPNPAAAAFRPVLACLQYSVAHSKPSKHFPSAAIVSRSVV